VRCCACLFTSDETNCLQGDSRQTFCLFTSDQTTCLEAQSRKSFCLRAPHERAAPSRCPSPSSELHILLQPVRCNQRPGEVVNVVFGAAGLNPKGFRLAIVPLNGAFTISDSFFCVLQRLSNGSASGRWRQCVTQRRSNGWSGSMQRAGFREG
jgi:hypothetical protein